MAFNNHNQDTNPNTTNMCILWITEFACRCKSPTSYAHERSCRAKFGTGNKCHSRGVQERWVDYNCPDCEDAPEDARSYNKNNKNSNNNDNDEDEASKELQRLSLEAEARDRQRVLAKRRRRAEAAKAGVPEVKGPRYQILQRGNQGGGNEK